jgi:hypothetical protein
MKEDEMKVAPVYRKDYRSGQRMYLGFVVERRVSDRGGNIVGLARLARKVFAEPGGSDPISIIVGGVRDAEPGEQPG